MTSKTYMEGVHVEVRQAHSRLRNACRHWPGEWRGSAVVCFMGFGFGPTHPATCIGPVQMRAMKTQDKAASSMLV